MTPDEKTGRAIAWIVVLVGCAVAMALSIWVMTAINAEFGTAGLVLVFVFFLWRDHVRKSQAAAKK